MPAALQLISGPTGGCVDVDEKKWMHPIGACCACLLRSALLTISLRLPVTIKCTNLKAKYSSKICAIKLNIRVRICVGT